MHFLAVSESWLKRHYGAFVAILLAIAVPSQLHADLPSVGVNAGSFSSFEKYTSSGSKNLENETIQATENVVSVDLDGQSVTTLVGSASE